MLPPGYAELSLPSSQTLADDYLRHLRSRIAELGFKEMEFIGIAHDRIMEKAIKRQKPFNEGGSGYQDCLICETILQKIANERDPTYLVTENYKDFATDDKQSLHPNLLEDIRLRGIPEGCIQYIRDLKTLIDSLIAPDMPAVKSEERLSAFADRLVDDSILTDWISDNADKIMAALNKAGIDLDGAVREAEDVYVRHLEHPKSFEIDTISAISDQAAVVIATTEIDASIAFVLHRSEYMIADPPYPFSVVAADWNDHYIAAEMVVRLSLRFVFSVSLETEEVLAFEVEDQTELCGYCRRCGAIQYNYSADRCRSCKRRLT
jgi:hypothetical protein